MSRHNTEVITECAIQQKRKVFWWMLKHLLLLKTNEQRGKE
jgi:hypothetical protein